MKQYKYNRYTLRLTEDMAQYVKTVAEHRGMTPSAFIKAIIGEYREVNEHGKDRRKEE